MRIVIKKVALNSYFLTVIVHLNYVFSIENHVSLRNTRKVEEIVRRTIDEE